MKIYTYNILLLLTICLGITSCSEYEWEEHKASNEIELTISCADLNNTRATMDGEPEYNENMIRSLHYFFYRSGQTGGNALAMGRVKLESDTQHRAVVRIPLNDTELNTLLFPRPAQECEVYIIANLPDDFVIQTSNTSINTLKTLAVTANFKDQFPQSSFIMDGMGKATIGNRNNTIAATGTIQLSRLAAKITTRISVESQFVDTDGKIWIPAVEQMTVKIENAVSNTTLAATFGTQHFNYAERNYMGTQSVTEGNQTRTRYVYDPFYSYPCTWDYRDEKAFVMYVELPWKSQDSGSDKYERCYYKVFLNTMQLDRNSWYNLDMNISVLGSFASKEEALEIKDFTYQVVDWKNGINDWTAGLEIVTEILSAHYLVVEKNEYVVNNKNTFEIPFVSSHKCKIKDLTVTRQIFKSGNSETPTDEVLTTTATNNNWLTLDGNTIKLNHTLNNDFIGTTNYDYSPYTFTFTLCHENNETHFYEHITIIQKPAISITAHLNSLYEYNNTKTSGYQYVNGYAPTSTNTYSYGGAHGLTGSNKNPYMYTIEVTVLPSGSNYILGDPRSETSSVPPGNNATNAPGIEGTTSRKLQKYYGTKTDESVQNMIAPKFRIASSHGVTNSITHTNAINRAATYQEDGYPAGRWRVPTMAEVQFIIKLSADGKIPELFSTGSAYWCANGKVTPNTGGGFTPSVGTSGNGPVRCVYDDWYWEHSQWPRMASRGNHPNKYDKFTWGDEIN